MNKLITLILFASVTNVAVSQEHKNILEIRANARWDRYPSFMYSINSLTQNRVTMEGVSHGLSIGYGHGIGSKLRVKYTIGYYRYSFTNIKKLNSSFGEGNSRTIEYPLYDMIYGTPKYWYHTLCFSVGLERYFPITQRIDFLVAGHVQYYRTFGQYYKIFDVYEYKLHQNRNFAYGSLANAGINLKYNRLSVTPQITVPLYEIWHRDDVFPNETNTGTRSKWFGGLGIAVGFQYGLGKNFVKQ